MEFFTNYIQLFESGFSEFKWELEIPLFSLFFFLILVGEKRDNGAEVKWVV